MNTGKLYIISAPSGAGKTSLIKQVVADLSSVVVSVSHTTRPRRPKEVEGQDYFFVSTAEFQRNLAVGDFLENAEVFGNLYGSSRQYIETALATADVILEIDWQGAAQVKQSMPDSLGIFIFPPSVSVLQSRLLCRDQDNEEVIAARMQDARQQLSHCQDFDYWVVNDDFATAAQQICAIISAERLTKQRQQGTLAPLLVDLL